MMAQRCPMMLNQRNDIFISANLGGRPTRAQRWPDVVKQTIMISAIIYVGPTLGLHYTK